MTEQVYSDEEIKFRISWLENDVESAAMLEQLMRERDAARDEAVGILECERKYDKK